MFRNKCKCSEVKPIDYTQMHDKNYKTKQHVLKMRVRRLSTLLIYLMNFKQFQRPRKVGEWPPNLKCRGVRCFCVSGSQRWPHVHNYHNDMNRSLVPKWNSPHLLHCQSISRRLHQNQTYRHWQHWSNIHILWSNKSNKTVKQLFTENANSRDRNQLRTINLES